MKLHFLLVPLVLFALFTTIISPKHASAVEISPLEKSVSDTLDLWRDGQYEKLFDRLGHRGKTSREKFVKKMHDASVKPACCWQKIENFKVLDESAKSATVYAKIGLEGSTGIDKSSTREFKLIYEEGIWKMQLKDISALASLTAKKKGTGGHSSKKKKSL